VVLEIGDQVARTSVLQASARRCDAGHAVAQPKLRSQLYDSVEVLQADLDAWLHHYNHDRPHLGHRNQGRRP
jgi:hypothetical protein